ncbi:hypothetical protein BDQ17DRAFT_1430575 [Cyathus striatus]|nr:hypothetical protein BDQ17DRAFT_1430575 [Cyathus striatus]
MNGKSRESNNISTGPVPDATTDTQSRIPNGENQCLFLRGFKISLSEEVWKQIDVQDVILNENGKRPADSDDSYDSKKGKRPRNNEKDASENKESLSDNNMNQKNTVSISNFPAKQNVPGARVAITHDNQWLDVGFGRIEMANTFHDVKSIKQWVQSHFVVAYDKGNKTCSLELRAEVETEEILETNYKVGDEESITSDPHHFEENTCSKSSIISSLPAPAFNFGIAESDSELNPSLKHYEEIIPSSSAISGFGQIATDVTASSIPSILEYSVPNPGLRYSKSTTASSISGDSSSRQSSSGNSFGHSRHWLGHTDPKLPSVASRPEYSATNPGLSYSSSEIVGSTSGDGSSQESLEYERMLQEEEEFQRARQQLMDIDLRIPPAFVSKVSSHPRLNHVASQPGYSKPNPVLSHSGSATARSTSGDSGSSQDLSHAKAGT